MQTRVKKLAFITGLLVIVSALGLLSVFAHIRANNRVQARRDKAAQLLLTAASEQSFSAASGPAYQLPAIEVNQTQDNIRIRLVNNSTAPVELDFDRDRVIVKSDGGGIVLPVRRFLEHRSGSSLGAGAKTVWVGLNSLGLRCVKSGHTTVTFEHSDSTGSCATVKTAPLFPASATGS